MHELRSITPSEFERWMRVEVQGPTATGFNHDPRGKLRPHFDLDRSHRCV